jgi:hypothetical protein
LIVPSPQLLKEIEIEIAAGAVDGSTSDKRTLMAERITTEYL